MSGNLHLNGSDYLMLGFDHELRHHGFAGNSCQITLELAAPISPAALRQRLEFLVNRHPILRALPCGIVFPKWKIIRGNVTYPQVRVHHHEPEIEQKLFNESLASRRGELMRFDLIENSDGRMTLVFTWAHALMDALGAEQFLAIVGNEKLPLPAVIFTPLNRVRLGLRERFRLAWKCLYHIEQFGKVAPRSIGNRNLTAPAQQNYHVVKFTVEETARICVNSRRLGGVLGDAQFHAAATMVELHQLHQRLGAATPSYVLPVAVGLRPKGTSEPVFSNQLAMLMLQFFPNQLESVATAVACLKKQTAEALRAGLLDSGVELGKISSLLPLPIYMTILKQGLRGEICSMFYGDTAAVNPHLTTFFGVTIEDVTHAAPVTPAPGIGVIFYTFRGALRVTVLHSLNVINETEAAEFSTNLRARLLNP